MGASTNAKPKSSGEELLTVQLALAIGGERVAFEATVPRAPTRPRRLLPLLQAITEEVVARAEREVHERGETISCKAGCGACCRHLVTVSKAEAHQIRELVETMPEPRRTEVRARFSEAHRRLDEGGLGALARGAKGANEAKLDPDRIAGDYFALGIACPFLENESCSIYADRPLICREYLMTSPPELCAERPPEELRRVPIAARVSESLRAVERRDGDGVGWIPLSVAPAWAAAHPEIGHAMPGPELTRAVLRALSSSTARKPKR